jgi:hypothetical protein
MMCGGRYLVKSKPTFYTLWRQSYGITWMRMRHIQLGERGRGGQVKYADGHCTNVSHYINYREISYVFLPQLISYISHFSYSEFQRVHGEVLKKSGG